MKNADWIRSAIVVSTEINRKMIFYSEFWIQMRESERDEISSAFFSFFTSKSCFVIEAYDYEITMEM